MLIKGFNLVFISAIAIQASIVPLDLVDDANEKLESLRLTVLGAIFSAENDLDDFNLDLQYFGTTTERSATVTIGNEELTINGSLANLKALAHSAEADISYCLQGRENYLNNLPIVILADLNDCIFRGITEGSKVLSEIKYLVDITINTVNLLDFRLGLCQADSEECINPLVEQIELEKEKIPQQIKVEVLKAEELFAALKVSLEECADLKVSQYVSSATTILSDITQCVNTIIG